MLVDLEAKMNSTLNLKIYFKKIYFIYYIYGIRINI